MNLAYTYGGLDSTRREIRLLHLLPGTWEEPLRCSLQVVSLDDNPVYQGLSYTWGKEGVTRPTQLHGMPFEVTVNLWAALRRLRRRHFERVLWIDAICINQNDLEERSYQVALMGEIFSHACEVLVWLGDSLQISEENAALEASTSTFEDGKDMNWISDLNERSFTGEEFADEESMVMAAFGTLHLLSVDEHWTEKPLFAADASGRLQIARPYMPAWQATLMLLQLPWWSRVWVVQELVLSQKATLILGPIAAPWSLISGFCESYLKHLPPGACCHSSATWKMTSDLWAEFVLMRLTVWSFHTARTDWIHPPSKPPHAAFLQLLWLLRHKGATDPRDKVYGLLGLLRGDAQALPLLIPDYSVGTTETFARCTEALIRADNTLKALVGPRLRKEGLPTWVIDLLPEDHAGSVLFFQNILKRISSSSVFDACRRRGLQYDRRSSTLVLFGIRVDIIKDTVPAWEENLVAPTFTAWEDSAYSGHPEVRYPSGCTRGEAFWRTVVRDTIIQYHTTAREKIRRATTGDKRSYTRFRKWLGLIEQEDKSNFESKEDTNTMQHDDADLPNFRKSFFIATQDQHFFTTWKRYMGLGDAPQPGDEIWVLFGGSVPFILRPCTDAGRQDCGRGYKLVGDCYVHGVMDGEAMEGWKENGTRRVVLV